MKLENTSTFTAEEATEILRSAGMRITAETLRNGITQGKFPFGISVDGNGGGLTVYAFPAPLDEFIHWAWHKRLSDVAPAGILKRVGWEGGAAGGERKA